MKVVLTETHAKVAECLLLDIGNSCDVGSRKSAIENYAAFIRSLDDVRRMGEPQDHTGRGFIGHIAEPLRPGVTGDSAKLTIELVESKPLSMIEAARSLNAAISNLLAIIYTDSPPRNFPSSKINNPGCTCCDAGCCTCGAWEKNHGSASQASHSSPSLTS